MALRSEFDVITARNGEEAVRFARAELPDLILMDVNMPVMTGIEATRALRDDAATHDIPIVIVSTFTETTTTEALLAGCVDYVFKPIDTSELLAKVRQLLAERE